MLAPSITSFREQVVSEVARIMAIPEFSAGSEAIDLEAQLSCEEQPYTRNSDGPETSALLRLATSIDRFEQLAVFRRFGDLSILSILCLQTELLHLRSKLVLQTRDSIANREIQHNNENASIDLKPYLDVDGELNPELELLEKIRGKMVKYSPFLLPPFPLTVCT